MLENVYDYQSLPKKRMAASALFFNESGNILIVEPTYRPDWLLPGGAVEAYESPREGCVREVKEELNLDIALEKLLCIEYLAEDGKRTECIQFVFYGGILYDDQITAIVLPSEELSTYRFAALADAQQLLSRVLAKRLPYCLQACESNTTIYLEDGRLFC